MDDNEQTSLEWTETAVDYVIPAADAEESGLKGEVHVVVFVVDLTFSKHQRHLVTESIKRVGYETSMHPSLLIVMDGTV